MCPVEELPPGEVKIVRAGDLAIGVYNLDGEFYAIEDRCSHDDGPLAEGDFEPDEGVAICPRHGSRFDMRTGRALTLPPTSRWTTSRSRSRTASCTSSFPRLGARGAPAEARREERGPLPRGERADQGGQPRGGRRRALRLPVRVRHRRLHAADRPDPRRVRGRPQRPDAFRDRAGPRNARRRAGTLAERTLRDRGEGRPRGGAHRRRAKTPAS